MLQILDPVIDYLDLFLDYRHPLGEAVVLACCLPLAMSTPISVSPPVMRAQIIVSVITHSLKSCSFKALIWFPNQKSRIVILDKAAWACI